MADKTIDDSAKRRQKLFHNKTLMAQSASKDELTLPKMPEPEEKEQKKGFGGIKGLFRRNKKPAEDEELKIDYPITGGEEPDFLMDIDRERHENRIEPELALWLNDGRIVKSTEDLAKALRTMKGRIFTQHKENNEISNWVRDVTGNAQLASELEAAKTKRDAIKILENHVKASRKKKAAERPEKREIQKAIDEIRKKPEVFEKSRPLEEREKALEERERQLDFEEDIINKKRMTLANRRYQLIKERGELEKEKFEKIVKHHHDELRETGMETRIEHEGSGLPETELTQEYTKERIIQLISQARNELDHGNTGNAQATIGELKNALDYAAIEPAEIKKLEYEILGLEADLKLAMLA